MSWILRWGTGVSVLWVLAAGPGAQAPATPQPQHSTDDRAAARVTVSGCIERADAVLPTEPGASTADSLTFVLIRALPTPPGPATTTPVATSGTADAGTLGRTYRLDATMDRLNPHIGHTVEVTGTLEDAPTEPAGAGSPTNPRRLRVETVKMLDAICPR